MPPTPNSAPKAAARFLLLPLALVVVAGCSTGINGDDGNEGAGGQGAGGEDAVCAAPIGAPLSLQFHQLLEEAPAGMPEGDVDRRVSHVVASSDGNFFAVEAYNVPTGPTEPLGPAQAVVSKLDPAGVPIWTKRFDAPGVNEVKSIVAEPDGGALVSVRVAGQTDLGPAGDYVVRYDDAGTVLSADPVDGVRSAAPHPDGGFVTLHDGQFGLVLSRVGASAFDLPLQGFSFASAVGPSPVFVAADGSIYFAGYIEAGEGSVAGTTIPGPGRSMVFLRISPEGQLLTAKQFTSPETYDGPIPITVAEAPGGQLLVSALIDGVFDLGGGPIGVADRYSAIVVALSPSGDHLWSRVVGEWGSYSPLPVLATSDCLIGIVAASVGSITIGSGTVPAAATDNPNEAVFLGLLSSDGDLVSSWRLEASTRGLALLDDNSAVLGGGFNHLRISSLDVVNSNIYRGQGFLVRTDPL